jgi:two-component system NtrC family sensor kinase
MRKIWRQISNLGINKEISVGLQHRSLILSNQVNFLIVVIMFFIVLFLGILRLVEGSTMTIGSVRLLMVLLVSLLNLILAYYGKPKLARFLLLLLPPFIVFILPTIVGFVEQESYVYYPLAIIVISVVPHLLLTWKEDKFLLFFCLIVYFVLMVFIESFLTAFNPNDYPLILILDGFLVYTKMVQIMSFIFLHFAIYYLQSLNRSYEEEITSKNIMLDRQNKELNETLRNLNEIQRQLFQAERMTALGTLTSGVAHEINNPLNYISGGVQVLEDEIMNFNDENKSLLYPKLEQPIHIIKEGISRASNIVNTLFSLAADDTAGKKFTDVHEVIDQTLLFMNHRIPQNITVKKEYKLDQQIPLIKSGFQQVLLSILQNALTAIASKNGYSNESITIRTLSRKIMKEKSIVVIEIYNSGPLIPNHIIRHIFDPFFTTQEAGKGTGLGLTIAYKLIKDQGGTITVENSYQGVCFIIILPIDDGEL